MSNKEQSWFEKNMHAEKTELGFANCSACSLRNVPKMCETLATSCCCAIEQDGGGFITWQPNNTGLGYDLLSCHPPHEMTEWFKNTSPAEIRRITEQMVRDVFSQKQK